MPHQMRIVEIPIATKSIRMVVSDGNSAYQKVRSAVMPKPTQDRVRTRTMSATMPEGK